MQKLPIAGTSVLTACQSSGNVFVAATGSDGIHQLAPVPFDQQAKALADVDQFAEALTMIAYLHDSQVHRKACCKCALCCAWHTQSHIDWLGLLRHAAPVNLT